MAEEADTNTNANAQSTQEATEIPQEGTALQELDLSNMENCQKGLLTLLTQESLDPKQVLGIFNQLMTAAKNNDNSPQTANARRLLDVAGLYIMTHAGENQAFAQTLLPDTVASIYDLLPENGLVKSCFSRENDGKIKQKEGVEIPASQNVLPLLNKNDGALLSNDDFVKQICFHGLDLQGINLPDLSDAFLKLEPAISVALIQRTSLDNNLKNALCSFIDPQGHPVAGEPCYDNILLNRVGIGNYKQLYDFQNVLAGALNTINAETDPEKKKALFKQLYGNAWRLAQMAPTKNLKQTANEALTLLDKMYSSQFDETADLKQDPLVQQTGKLQWWESLLAGAMYLFWPIVKFFMPALANVDAACTGGLMGVMQGHMGNSPNLVNGLTQTLQIDPQVQQNVYNLLQNNLAQEKNQNYTEVAKGLISQMTDENKMSVGAGILQYLNTPGANKQAIYDIFQTLKNDPLTKEQFGNFLNAYPGAEDLLTTTFFNGCDTGKEVDASTQKQIMTGVIQGLAEKATKGGEVYKALDNGFKGDDINVGALLPLLGHMEAKNPDEINQVLVWLRDKGPNSPEIKNVWIALAIGKEYLKDPKQLQQIDKLEKVLETLGHPKPEISPREKQKFYEKIFEKVLNTDELEPIEKGMAKWKNCHNDSDVCYHLLCETFSDKNLSFPRICLLEGKVDKLFEQLNDMHEPAEPAAVMAFMRFARNASPKQAAFLQCVVENKFPNGDLKTALTTVLSKKANGETVCDAIANSLKGDSDKNSSSAVFFSKITKYCKSNLMIDLTMAQKLNAKQTELPPAQVNETGAANLAFVVPEVEPVAAPTTTAPQTLAAVNINTVTQPQPDASATLASVPVQQNDHTA